VLHLSAGLVEDFTEQHLYRFQVRREALVFRRGQGGEEMVLTRTMR
jgi:hypothetical protein